VGERGKGLGWAQSRPEGWNRRALTRRRDRRLTNVGGNSGGGGGGGSFDQRGSSLQFRLGGRVNSAQSSDGEDPRNLENPRKPRRSFERVPYPAPYGLVGGRSRRGGERRGKRTITRR